VTLAALELAHELGEERTSMATSKKVASKAAKILKDGRFSKTSKSVAGSALAGKKKAKRR
jgi:hypothetical protein